MRLHQLERLLATWGFSHARQTGSHHTYRHVASGRTLTIAAHSASQFYGRAEVQHILRSLYRTLALGEH
ncbi:MAG TPA: type II toxin-antitoxin system HicA family toxin [Ktedonobacterales bacterium]|nr:type II toxin-antitoxin system HicA family toxin [Ktedonobacterales bacterium]